MNPFVYRFRNLIFKETKKVTIFQGLELVRNGDTRQSKSQTTIYERRGFEISKVHHGW